jgi:hypothetical protein
LTPRRGPSTATPSARSNTKQPFGTGAKAVKPLRGREPDAISPAPDQRQIRLLVPSLGIDREEAAAKEVAI